MRGVAMFVNAHAHLGIDEILDKALIDIVEHKIVFVSCSVDIPSYKEALKIAERSEWILPAFGIHPSRAHHYADKLDMLKDFFDTCLMMGEIGLDHFFVKDTSISSANLCIQTVSQSCRTAQEDSQPTHQRCIP
jgi:TatD DNase family protein